MSFRIKTIIGVALIEIVLLAIFTVSSLNFLSGSTQRELDVLAANTTKLFAALTKDALLATDLDRLEIAVIELMTSPDVVYVRIRDEFGTVVESGDSKILSWEFSPDLSFQSATDGIFDIQRPIIESGYHLGTIEIGFTVERLQNLISDARQRFIFIALIEIFLVALFSLALGTYLTSNLKRISLAAKRISDGDIGTQVVIKGKDELDKPPQHSIKCLRRL